jgi:hypothetical protein
VGHEEDRLGQLLLQPQQLVLQALPDDRIDRPEGLVHEHDRRVRGERPGDPHALPLTARQLGRKAVAVAAGLQADQRQQLVGALPEALLPPAQQAGHRDRVLADRLVGEEPNLLDHVADAPAQLGHVAGHDVDAVDQNLPAGWLDQPVDHLEAGRLAAARRSHEDADPAGRHRERQVVHGPRGAARPRVVALRDVAELDGGGAPRGFGHGRSSPG